MKVKLLRELSEKDLGGKLQELEQEMLKLRTQISKGASPKVAGQIQRAKKTVARIKTIMNERRKS